MKSAALNIMLAITCLWVSCNSDHSGHTNLVTKSKPENGDNDKSKMPSDTLDFLSNCVHLTRFSSYQGLQGTNASVDSTEYLCIANCYTCKETYELIFKYKGTLYETKKLGKDFIFDEFHSGCSNNFDKFSCFAFVYPMKEPEPGECEDAKGNPIPCDLGIKFPVNVKIYTRDRTNRWIFQENVEKKNFEELSMLFFKTVY
jgi:hypothetical protein